MLHKFYANLTNDFEKRKFLEKITKKCMVSPGTARSWVCDPSRASHRNPRPLFRKHIAKIARIPGQDLFPDQNY